MKDTAVKFLIDEISCRFIISEELRIAMYKAIEMEKEQIMKAFKVGFSNGFASDILSTEKLQKEKERLFCEWFEQYYNETFKSE